MNVDLNTLSKTETGRKRILKEIAAYANTVPKANDRVCWELYNNQIDKTQFDYLRKYGGYELPAKVKHIPKQRPYIEWLTSRQARRAFLFSISAVDNKSLERKIKSQAKTLVEKNLAKYKKNFFEYIGRIQMLEQKQQEIINSLSQEPKNEEEAAMIQQAQAALPQINSQIEYIKDAIKEIQVFNQKEIDKLKRYFAYEDKDHVEELAQKAMRSYRREMQLQLESLQNFINFCVTGREYYYVDYVIGDRKPIYKHIPPQKVFYPNVEGVQWVQDLDWAGFEEKMTYSNVMSNWGHLLSSDDKINLKNYDVSMNVQDGVFIPTETDGAIYHPDALPSGTSPMTGEGISVKRVWWLCERTIRAIQKPNPYRKGKFFTNFIDNEEVIRSTDYSYNNSKRMWKNKENNSIMYKESEVKTYNPKKGERYEVRYVYDRYKGVIINDQIFISEKDPVQPRSIDNLSTVPLPIVGPTFNSLTNQPYSLVWSTKELQETYDIVFYHRDLMLAVSGTKTLLMDILQKPDDIDDDEFEYQKKIGNVDIESRKTGVGHQQPTFNQFQVLDLSLSNSIQYFDRILESIDAQIGLVMGITRQAMGQTVNSDQVGTFEMSQQSTLLITEILFARHDEIERQALTALLHLAKTYCFDKEAILQIVDPDGGNEIVRIPGGVLNLADFEIIVFNNAKEESNLNELKQLALANYQKGLIPFHNFVSMYNVESLKELEKMSQYYSEKAEELRIQAENATLEKQKQITQEAEQMKADMVMMVEKQKENVEKMKLQFEGAKLEYEKYVDGVKQDFEDRKLEQEKLLKLYELNNEAMSEQGVLAMNDKHATVDEKIRMLQLELEAIQMTFDKDSADKKNKVEDKKASKMVKEHVSDK
ncbi:MAG: hypothetical protein H8E51_08625 [Bacteroidetes bacterium]|nr:hypothetical protein [Bacteroidota bacterium]